MTAPAETPDTPPPHAPPWLARLRDVGVLFVLIGVFGSLFPPRTHSNPYWHGLIYFAAFLVLVAGATILMFSSIIFFYRLWHQRRQQSLRGFEVVPAKPRVPATPILKPGQSGE